MCNALQTSVVSPPNDADAAFIDSGYCGQLAAIQHVENVVVVCTARIGKSSTDEPRSTPVVLWSPKFTIMVLYSIGFPFFCYKTYFLVSQLLTGEKTA